MQLIRRYLLLPFLLALFCSASIQAQDRSDSTAISKKRKARMDVEMLYNFGHIGQNISFNFTRYLGKKGRHAITGGLKYHLRTRINNNSSTFNGWRFRPKYGLPISNGPSRSWHSFIEPFIYGTGLNFGYKYSFPNHKASSLSPFLFYQLQITLGMPATKDDFFTESFTVYEHAIGGGIQPKLHKKVSGLVSAGFGSTRFHYAQGGFWERSLNFRFGVTYTIGKTIE